MAAAKNQRIMERIPRKRSSGFGDYFRLGLVNVNDCPTGLEPPAGAKNRRKATVKIRRNQ